MLNQLPVWEKLAKEIIWQQIGGLKGKTILDFGSGVGITANHFAVDNQVTAIEPSEDMLAQQVSTNDYQQIIGSTDELKKLPSDSFDYKSNYPTVLQKPKGGNFLTKCLPSRCGCFMYRAIACR